MICKNCGAESMAKKSGCDGVGYWTYYVCNVCRHTEMSSEGVRVWLDPKEVKVC